MFIIYKLIIIYYYVQFIFPLFIPFFRFFLQLRPPPLLQPPPPPPPRPSRTQCSPWGSGASGALVTPDPWPLTASLHGKVIQLSPWSCSPTDLQPVWRFPPTVSLDAFRGRARIEQYSAESYCSLEQIGREGPRPITGEDGTRENAPRRLAFLPSRIKRGQIFLASLGGSGNLQQGVFPAPAPGNFWGVITTSPATALQAESHVRPGGGPPDRRGNDRSPDSHDSNVVAESPSATIGRRTITTVTWITVATGLPDHRGNVEVECHGYEMRPCYRGNDDPPWRRGDTFLWATSRSSAAAAMAKHLITMNGRRIEGEAKGWGVRGGREQIRGGGGGRRGEKSPGFYGGGRPELREISRVVSVQSGGYQGGGGTSSGGGGQIWLIANESRKGERRECSPRKAAGSGRVE